MTERQSDEYGKCVTHHICACLEAKLAEQERRIAGLVEAMKKAKGAMTYAYDDHCDQFYLNVKDDIDKALEKFGGGK